MDNCPICSDASALFFEECVNCEGCGFFYWEATKIIDDEETQIKLSGWICEQNRNNPDNNPTIDDKKVQEIAARPMPTVMQRADYILLEMNSQLSFITDNFALNPENSFKLYRASYSSYKLKGSNESELAYLLQKILFDEGYVEMTNQELHILPKGHIRIEELRKKQGGQNAFVAMWFGGAMDNAYEQGIEKGIKAAGYEAVRIDKKDHSNKIDDEIMVEIKSAAFVVADFTGHRGGVYFEAGYALGLGKPVIWTCRDAHLQDLHFDIRQYNCLTWKDAKFDEADKKNPPKDRKPYEAGDELDVFAENLKNRIMAAAGRGPSYRDTDD